ncbi:hypothetical protein KKI17_02265 [Patescibacteria group bacterium]|nr:hypothetical protein [Patescibacteria group bacterium]
MTFSLFLPLYRSRAAWLISVILVALLACFYVLQINLLTQMAYHISFQERALEELAEGTKKLEARSAAALSFQEFEHTAESLGLVKIARMQYVESGGTRVAQNQ